MQQSFLLILGALLAGSCLVQGQCDGFKNFSSHTFDLLYNTRCMSYHDTSNFRTLFDNLDTPGNWILYDFTEGRIYDYVLETGRCIYIEAAGAKLTPNEAATNFKPEIPFTNLWGFQGMSYTLETKDLLVRGLLRDDCMEFVTYILVEGVTHAVAVHDAFETGDEVDMKIAARLAEARAVIDTGNCEQIPNARGESLD